MDKYEYIKLLENKLAELSEDERNSAVNYYKELFEDAGSENEADLISKLGSPDQLAESIIRESGMVAVQNQSCDNTSNVKMPDVSENTSNGTAQKKKLSGLEIGLIIAVIVLTFPLWIGIVGTLFGIAIALIATVFALIVTLFCVSIGGIIGGIFELFVSPAKGVFLIGAGLICSSLIFLLMIPAWKLLGRFFGWLTHIIPDIWHKLFGGKEVQNK